MYKISIRGLASCQIKEVKGLDMKAWRLDTEARWLDHEIGVKLHTSSDIKWGEQLSVPR